jgi:hypothetical protein
MIYAPPNPIVYMGSSLTITDTVRSYFNSYTFYQWERKPFGGSWATIGTWGTATPVFNPLYGQWEYVQAYTIPGTATLAGNAGDEYRMVVASSVLNLTNGCNFTPSVWFTLLPTDAACAFSATNYAVTPQSGHIDWNKLNWSLGHVPTCCESAHITYTGTNPGADEVVVNITNDICIINLTLQNTASSGTNKIFKTILHPGYNMQMNGYVRMGAPAALSSDSAIFIARGGGTITVNRNTTIGQPGDNAYSIFGSAPNTTTYANYRLRGDSLTFNAKGLTNHKFTSVALDPYTNLDTIKLVNNTNSAPYSNAVTFDRLSIGSTRTAVVITGGSNQNSYVNDNNGYVDIISGSTLVLPANYSLNAKDFVSAGTFKSDLFLRSNSTLKLGGISGGITGSNFPANFSSYTLNPTSTTIFYGAAQTIPGTVNNVNAYGHLTLTGTGVKTATSSTINIAGNLYRTNTGHTFNANSGRVSFNSSTVGQRYYADAGATPINFYDFTNDNTFSSGLSIDSTIGILNEFELKPNTRFTLNTGDVIMRSSAARTSYVKNLGLTIPTINYNTTYRFVVERYLFPRKSWRFLATPITVGSSPTITNAWREGAVSLLSTGYGTQITGPASYIGMDTYTQRGSIKSYNSTLDTWVEVTNTANPLVNNTGYMIFVRGDRAVPILGAAGATNLRIKGQIRTGPQSFAVAANKFQSVGNPFAARIDFRTMVKSNIANAFTVWNPNSPGMYNVGAYETYIWNGTNYARGAAVRNTIESGEAFFIQNNSASAGSLTVAEADKGTGSAMVSRAGITIPTLEVSLLTYDQNDSLYHADYAIVNFGNNYTNAINNDDVRKMLNTADNLSIRSNATNLVADRRPFVNSGDSIELILSGARVAKYQFEIDPSVLGNLNLSAFLKDKFLLTETAISLTDVTNIPFEIINTAASRAADRFVILFRDNNNTNFTNIAVSRNAESKVDIKWGVANEKDVVSYNVERSKDAVNFGTVKTEYQVLNNNGDNNYFAIDVVPSAKKYWYRIMATFANGTIKHSAVALLNPIIDTIKSNEESKIEIFPNPIQNGLIKIFFSHQQKGIYNIQVTNAQGQLIKSQNVEIITPLQQQTVKIPTAAVGKYNLTITDSQGNKTTLPFVIQ